MTSDLSCGVVRTSQGEEMNQMDSQIGVQEHGEAAQYIPFFGLFAIPVGMEELRLLSSPTRALTAPTVGPNAAPTIESPRSLRAEPQR